MVDKNLLKAVREGVRSLQSLTNDEFEDIVAAIALEQFKKSAADITVIKDRRYAIDIAIQYMDNDPVSPETKRHFIEAKNSSGNLPLDRVAKAYCAALRYVPSSLTLALHDGIQPQALEYAHELFTKRADRNTKIKIMQVARSLDPSEAWVDLPDNYVPSTSRLPFAELEAWELWKDTAFTSERIASSSNDIETIELDATAITTLRLFCSVSSGNLSDTNILVSEPGIKIHEQTQYGDQARIDLRISPQDLGADFGSVTVSFQRATRTDALKVTLPKILSEPVFKVLPPLRSTLTRKWQTKISNQQGPKLVFVHGEAGVGKTTFCEHLCQQLQQAHGYQCFHIAIDESSEHRLFFRLFMALVLPQSTTGLELLTEHAELVKASIEAVIDEKNPGRIAEETFRALTNGGDPGDYLDVLARHIAVSGVQRIIVLSNCQKFSSTTLRALHSFVVTLETYGWSNIRILCEYRDTPDEHNPELEELARRLIAARVGSAAKVELNPISEADLRVAISETFPNNSARWISKALIDKTGGNPLFLENLLQNFLSHERIKPIPCIGGERTQFRVAEGVHFHDELQSSPDEIGELLRQRIQFFDAQLSREFSVEHVVLRTLGLAALQGLQVPSSNAVVVGLGQQQHDRQVQLLMRANLLSQAWGQGSVSFNHELIRVAAREMFRESSTLVEDCTVLLDTLKGSESPEIALTRAEVSVFIGRDNDAKEEFDQVFEAASQEPENFLLKRRSLRGLDGIFSSARRLPDREQLRHLDVLAELGWAEHNAGSALEASAVFRRALEGIRNISFDHGYLTPSVVAMQRSRFSQSLFGESVYCLELEHAPEYAQDALQNVPNLTEWGRILNRFVLFCHIADLTEIGHQVSSLALQYATASDDPEVNAVLCTDIGDFYLLANPVYSLQLRTTGQVVAKGTRQQIHNDLCVLVSELYATGMFSDSQLPELLERARSYGVHEVLGRISMLFGLKEFQAGHIDTARNHFQHAHQQAVLRGHWLLEVMADNNLMIIAAIQDNKEELLNRAATLHEFCETTKEQVSRAKHGVSDLVVLARSRASLLCTENSQCNADIAPELPLPSTPPKFSSWIALFYYNLSVIPLLSNAAHGELNQGLSMTQETSVSALAEKGLGYSVSLGDKSLLFALK